MGTKQFNNYEDLLTFTRASKGHALRPVSYGDEEVTNGTFDTDSDWNKSANSTISGGKATVSVTSGLFELIDQPITYKVGTIYRVTATVNGTSGKVIRFQDQTANNGGLTTPNSRVTLNGSDQEVSFIWVTNSASDVMAVARDTNTGDYSFTVDNVSVKEVTFDESDGTLTLFEHPENVPRVEYDADGNRLGLLVEEARTNLVTSSDATGWTVSAASATDNTETTLGAFVGAVVSSNGADWHRYRPANITVTSGTTYAVTLFYEYGTSGDVLLNFRAGSVANESRITGAWGSLTIPYQNAGTLTILEETALPQNVKKVVAKFVPNFSGNFEIGIGPNSNTSGETVIAYAAQCEQASFPTSYIKTTGSTATRSADVASLPVADFGFNASAGSLLVQCQHFTTETGATAAAAVALDDGSSNNRMWYYQNKGQWIGSSGGATQFSITGGDLAEDTEVKAGMVYSKDDFALYVDGSSVGIDTSGSVAEGVTTLHVGKAGGATVPLNGHINSIKYYPRRLTNAQLQALTEPRSDATLSLTFDGQESSFTENYIHG